MSSQNKINVFLYTCFLNTQRQREAEREKELMQLAWESCDYSVQKHLNVGVFYWGRF